VTVDEVAVEAETGGKSYLGTWLKTVTEGTQSPVVTKMLKVVEPIVHDASGAKKIIDDLLRVFDERSASGRLDWTSPRI